MATFSGRPVLFPLALIATLAACGGNGASPQMPPGTVTVVTLQSEPVTLQRELPGRTSAYLVAEVRPQVTGVIKERLFTEGGLVKAGQALYQLDDATYRADVASAEAALARAEALRESARLKAARSADLVRIDAVSAEEHESAVAAARQAEADVGVARAALQSARVRLGYARISAPISGRIGRSAVTAGALVTANQEQPLATVQRLDPIYVDVSQSSREYVELRRAIVAGTLRGDTRLPVQILLEDGSRHAHDGKLAFAEVSVDAGTGSYALRVVVPNPEGLLLPGMYVRASVAVGIREAGVLAPQQGITRDARGHATALVVGADGKVEQRTVQVSQAIGSRWLVDSGLGAGDRLIVEGLQKVRPGMPVQATEAATAAPAAASAAAR